MRIAILDDYQGIAMKSAERKNPRGAGARQCRGSSRNNRKGLRNARDRLESESEGRKGRVLRRAAGVESRAVSRGRLLDRPSGAQREDSRNRGGVRARSDEAFVLSDQYLSRTAD